MNYCTYRIKRSSGHLLAELLFGVIMMWMIGNAHSSKVVVGVAGGEVDLPCQLSAPDPLDRAVLALWYKQGHRLPVYSYDARGESGTHQPNAALLAARGTFITRGSPARLVLSPALASDQGLYTCRVDYINSATHNTVVNLTIIEPPEQILIFDKEETEVRGEMVGPINEGAPLKIFCLVKGGRPQPTVKWWSDGRELPTPKSQVTRSGDIRADLEIPEIKRSYQSKSFTCKAENNKQTKPLIRTVSLNMNLRPLSVEISPPSKPLIAGESYTFTCESTGSKPPSKITWLLDSHEIDPVRTRTRSEDGVTSCTVTLLLQSSDNEKILKCLAQNINIPGTPIHSVLKLNVQYPPKVALELGKNLKAGEIEQGYDVYFECKVDANPKPYRITWYRNKQEIIHNATTGVIMTSDSLVLQKVSRGGAGNYVCAATNVHGTERSNDVKLNIMYPPECMVDQPNIQAIGKGERVNISCRVASNPLRTTFHWKLNSSERTYHSHGVTDPSKEFLVSHYSFMGTSDKDFGRLLCWANNSVGVQKRACVFNIVPAGEPTMAEDCAILNNTAENIEVECVPGFDGGLKQRFIAEIFDESGSFHLNLTSDEPQFTIQSLEPGKTYVIRIWSYNEKGRSPSVTLSASTLKVAEKRMGETKTFFYSPLIVIFVGILGVFAVLIVLLVFITRYRKNISSTASASITRMPSPPPATKPNNNTTTTGGGATSNSTSNKYPSTLTSQPHLSSTTSNSQLKATMTGDEILPPKEGVMKKSPSGGGGGSVGDDEIAPKPKKRVMVLENGRVERTGVSNSPSPSNLVNRDESLLGNRYDAVPSLIHPNSSPGYYGSLGKPSYPSSPYSDIISLSPSSSAASSPTPAFPISGGPPMHHSGNGSTGVGPPPPHRNFPRIAVPPMNALSPLPEEYPPHHYTTAHHISTLPRNHRGHPLYDDRRSLLRPGDEGHLHRSPEEDEDRLLGGGGCRSSYRLGGGMASVGDRYHLVQEIKANPKYVVRRSGMDLNDESFV